MCWRGIGPDCGAGGGLAVGGLRLGQGWMVGWVLWVDVLWLVWVWELVVPGGVWDVKCEWCVGVGPADFPGFG